MTPEEQSAIKQTVDALSKGDLVVYPADTIWGVGCDASNAVAVKNLLLLKKRPQHKGLIIVVNSVQSLANYSPAIPEVAYELLEAATAPMTLVFDKGQNVAKEVLNEDGSIAIRIIHDGFMHHVLGKYRKAVVSTSPNVSGDLSPTQFSDIHRDIIEGVDWVVPSRYGKTMTGKPSSIIKIKENGAFSILRS